MLIRQKSCILMMYEVFYRRIPANIMRDKVHKSLFGSSSAGNELTKLLIGYTNGAKKKPLHSLD